MKTSVTYSGRQCFHAVIGINMSPIARTNLHHMTSLFIVSSWPSSVHMFSVHLENKMKVNSYQMLMISSGSVS
jgi:hypothetical protein